MLKDFKFLHFLSKNFRFAFGFCIILRTETRSVGSAKPIINPKNFKIMKNTELIPLKIEDKIIEIRNQNVILDSVVAELYGVQTMRINEAVKNNPDKFPKGYIIELKNSEFYDLRSKISIVHSKQSENQQISALPTNLGKTKVLPKAFTEKGLYMLATILKSPQATQATIAIVEAFAKLKELTNNIAFLNSMDVEVIEPEVIEATVEKTGGLLNDLFFSGLPTSAETSFELNLGLMKAKHSVKRENDTLKKELSEMKKMMAEIQKQLQKEK